MCNILSISNMWKVKDLIYKFPTLTLGPPLSFFPPPPFFFFPAPFPFPFPCVRQERRENERVRERESHRPGDHFAQKSRFRERSLNLAPSPDWLVNPLSISLSFRVFVFLGFRWKPVELHQIDCTMPLLFLKCLFVDFVFQFVTKFPIYGLPRNRFEFWYRSLELT